MALHNAAARELCSPSSPSSATPLSSTRRLWSQGALVRPAPRRSRVSVAALGDAAVLAATQQGVAFILWTAAETAVALSDSTVTSKEGRPEVVKQAVGAGAVGLATAFLQFAPLQLPGCILGILSSGVLMSDAVQRVQKVGGDAREFPGPKAWPAGSALIDFFMLNVFFQAARELLA